MRFNPLAVWQQVPVANRTVGAAASVTGAVGSLTTNNDKTGYSLTAGSYSIHASSNQRGNINVASVSTQTATISSVTITRTSCDYGGNDAQNDDVTKGSIRVALTNATTVSADCAVATPTSSRVCYEVEEMY